MAGSGGVPTFDLRLFGRATRELPAMSYLKPYAGQINCQNQRYSSPRLIARAHTKTTTAQETNPAMKAHTSSVISSPLQGNPKIYQMVPLDVGHYRLNHR